jgi:predicted Zn-ribbon and HTH transcriptional regulator
MNIVITCVKCGNVLTGRQKLYCSSKCKNNQLQSYLAQQARGLKRKRAAVLIRGGKCSICGYNKNLSALTFHHRNPALKEFKLDLRALSNRKQESINKEIQKCTLVCCNCHNELHHPQHNLERTS